VLLVDPAQNNSFRALNRAWKAGGTVRYMAPAGAKGARYAISGLADGALTDLVTSLALQAERAVTATGVEVKKPRIGLYRPWMPSMDEGWTRWVLEQYGFDYTNLTPADFHGATPLADRVDRRPQSRMRRAGSWTVSLGVVPPQYAGGIGANGVRALDAFVRGGGALVTQSRRSFTSTSSTCR
jgi:hypothetical protein